MLRGLKQKEAQYVRWFAEAEDKGDEGGMRDWHSLWKDKAAETELLMADPSEFVRTRGFLYGLEAPKEALKEAASSFFSFLCCFFLVFLIAFLTLALVLFALSQPL